MQQVAAAAADENEAGGRSSMLSAFDYIIGRDKGAGRGGTVAAPSVASRPGASLSICLVVLL